MKFFSNCKFTQYEFYFYITNRKCTRYDSFYCGHISNEFTHNVVVYTLLLFMYFII